MTIRFHHARLKCVSIGLCLLTVSLLIFYGKPKFIFRPHLHVPWLTNVRLVQPVRCIPAADQQGWPIAAQSNDKNAQRDNRLTVVLITARPEFNRLPLTLAALACHLDSRRLFEVIFLTPPEDIVLLRPYLSGSPADHWPWPLSIVSDDRLLTHTHTDSYRLQMIFKLIVAQIISTEYYMLLDSDCVALWPIHVEQLLWSAKKKTERGRSGPSFKALYQREERADREKWWPESEEILQIQPDTCVSNEPTSTTIGVTPIILSRTLALRTLCRLQALYGDSNFLNKLANWALWRVIFDRMWTEYTLYYLTARCTRTFDTYHIHRTNLSSYNTSTSLDFYGLSVWWQTDWTSYTRQQLVESVVNGLQWRQAEIARNNGQTIIASSTITRHLFTVLQGRQYINPDQFHQLLYPFFRKFLKQQPSTQLLVGNLDQMVENLMR